MTLKKFTSDQVGCSFVFLKDVLKRLGKRKIPIYRVVHVINYNLGTRVSVINLKSFQVGIVSETDEVVQNSEIRFIDLPR
jgi:hypothetical protein